MASQFQLLRVSKWLWLVLYTGLDLAIFRCWLYQKNSRIRPHWRLR